MNNKFKKCSICKIEKSLNNFYTDPTHKDGHQSRCKQCDNKNGKVYKSKHKIERMNYHLKWKYNISLEQKNRMIIDQNSKCASCGDMLGINAKNICIDHNHITKIVRKILCQKCNAALGFMEENVEKILKLAEYAKYCNQIK